jgi:hypothetical protein
MGDGYLRDFLKALCPRIPAHKKPLHWCYLNTSDDLTILLLVSIKEGSYSIQLL